MKYTLCLLLTAFILLPGCKKKKPIPMSFIIIFTDDMGYGDLGSYGHPTIQTPNLDKMASEGQKWTQFYVAAPVCTPSRAALLTGRYPIRNGMTSAKRGVLFPNSSGGLPSSEVTIAEVLKQKNYSTAAIGKWHLGHLPEYLPTNQGFDYYYGIPYSNDMNYDGNWEEMLSDVENENFQSDYKRYNVPLMENDQIIEQPVDQTTITYRYTEKALDFIKRNKETPFFLYLAHSMPHIPLFVNPTRVGTSKRALYGDVIEEIDWSVGKILETVINLNMEKHTMVIFTSDNGPWLAFKTHGGSAGPLRAGKGTTFEGGQRVPAIFWSPGKIEPGVVHEMGSTLDLINTISSIAKTEMPNDRKIDGYDLTPILYGQDKESPREDFYYWSSNAELFAVRSGEWKLHLQQPEELIYWNPTEPLPKPELFNLEVDIGEQFDVSDSYPEVVELLQDKIKLHLLDTVGKMDDNLAGTLSKQ